MKTLSGRLKGLLPLVLLVSFIAGCASQSCDSVGVPGFDLGYEKDAFGISSYWGPANIHCAPNDVKSKAKEHHPEWF